MIRTVGFISAISRAPITFRVSAVSGVCKLKKSARPQEIVDLATLSTPSSRAFSADRNGSKPRTVMPEPTRWPGHGQPDPPQADHTQRLALELRAGELVRSHCLT